MRKREELFQEFALTKPTKDSFRDAIDVQEKTAEYARTKLLLEVLCDVRELLGKLSVQKEVEGMSVGSMGAFGDLLEK